MKKPIPYGRQHIDDQDVGAVVEALRSERLTQGPAVERFERAVADYCGAQHVVAVCNATCALHLACRALGLGSGDLLWTSPITFVASANCARYCGADVDFVDIDPRTYNMSVEVLEAKLRQAAAAGRLPKIVVPVHLAGQPCETERIGALAKHYGFSVIEDASHAIGADYQDGKVGNCAYSDITVFSLHPVKIITTGEGGLLLTNRQDLFDRLALLRNHGITRDAARMTAAPEGPWYYQQVELGYNYRMTDIQAALGYSQMQHLDEFITRRRSLARRYDELLAGLPVLTPWQHPDGRSAWHLYIIQLQNEAGAPSRREVVGQLHAAGIQVNVHYIPIHLQPYYSALGFRRGAFPAAEAYYQRAITLPLFFDLTDSEQDYIAEQLHAAVQLRSSAGR